MGEVFDQYCKLMDEYLREMKERGDTERADDLCDRMDPLWWKMTDAEREESIRFVEEWDA